MIITEEEAKTKLCVDWATAPVIAPLVHPPRCRASECMAWRQTDFRLNPMGDNVIAQGFCGKAYAVRLP